MMNPSREALIDLIEVCVVTCLFIKIQEVTYLMSPGLFGVTVQK